MEVKHDMGQEHLLAQDCYKWASKGWRHWSRHFQRPTIHLEYETYKVNSYFQEWIKARGALVQSLSFVQN